MVHSDIEVIGLIQETSAGNKVAHDQLYELLYEDLKNLARKIRFNWRNAETLNTTALVHEAYLKVLSNENLTPLNRLHFFRLCGKAMRFRLQTYLEKKNAIKRGSEEKRVDLDHPDVLMISEESEEELFSLLSVLDKLEAEDELISKVVECRFFSDLTIDETAQVLSVSPATVKRKWTFARSYLSNSIRKSA
ncbi:MAG: ECF-type sigma factor [Cyclobacteriaceae bacterium]